jgi:hypothetical protein
MKAKQMVREAFRTVTFKRDGHKCRACGSDGELDAHHITNRNDMPNGGYVPENGISLCPVCHLKAEQCLINVAEIPGFHPSDLYKLIGSSYAEAVKAALKL